MGKKPEGTPYVEYYISMLLGFCQGPVDELCQVIIKDKNVFDADQDYANGVTLHINEPDKFGGNLREGGLVGALTYMPGRSTQEAPESLAKRVGLTPNTMPGMRGQAILWFCGDDNSGAKGFAVGCNMPNVPSIWARFRNKQTMLDNNHAVINDEGRKNSNPANMIYEALVHPNLMGGLDSQINKPMFNEVAGTLEDEEFGLSMLWDGQSTVESFIQDVLNHINGIMYFNPYTGLMDLKLLRNDYDVDTLPELGPDNCKLEQFRRPLWGEVIGEIAVTWTNPKNEETESFTIQDPAVCAMQGQVVSETRDFKGIRSRKIANKVCSREIRAAASPLASATIKVNRKVEKFLPGSLFKFTWPKRNIAQIVMRVLEIEWGTVDDAEITLKCIEDVFSFPYAQYSDPPDTSWDPGTLDPDVAITNLEYLFRATPISLINRRAPTGLGYEFSDDTYNKIAINTYVLPTDDQFDVNYYFPHRPSVDTLGNEVWASLGEKRVVGHATLLEAIEQEVLSTIQLSETIGPGDHPKVGWLGMFLGEDEYTDELFVFQERVGEQRWIVRRGVMDTIPAETWGVGTRVIIHPNNYNGYDWSERFADVPERYKFKARTSEGISGLSNEVVTTRPNRPYLPYRPANVKVEATMFGTEEQAQFIDLEDREMFDNTHEPRDWLISCTWSRRNRFHEDITWLKWDDADVPPEDDQTTEIIVMAGSEEIDRITGLTGTSHEFNIQASTARFTTLWLKFVSRRPHPDVPEGLESLQGMKIKLTLYYKGYGSDYGYFWGGWPAGPALTDIEFDSMGLLATSGMEVDSD